MVYLDSTKDLPEFIGSVVDERSFDGLLIRPQETVSADDVAALEQRSMPYVLIRARSLFRPANCVQLADEEEGYLATRHLVELGHDRIAFVGGGQDNPILVDRLRGYKRALLEAGIPFEDSLYRDGQLLQIGDAASREVISSLLSASPPPTALLVATSPLVRWTYYAIRDRGLRIPEDISVVGADEDVGGGLMTPALTRFGRSHYDLGISAAEFLIDLISNGMGEPREVVLPPCFQVAGSTASRQLSSGREMGLSQVTSR
jgi:LacI family transcriptional regulator